MKKLILISLVILSGLLVASTQVTPTSAANLANFKAGRIIDDVVFTKKDSMSVVQIQDFLNSKVPICDTNGTNRRSSGAALAHNTVQPTVTLHHLRASKITIRTLPRVRIIMVASLHPVVL